MKKLIAAIIAATFTMGSAYAQASTPAAAPVASAHHAKHKKVKHHKRHHKHHKKMKAAAAK